MYNDGIQLTPLHYHPLNGDEMNDGVADWNQKSPSHVSARKLWMNWETLSWLQLEISWCRNHRTHLCRI